MRAKTFIYATLWALVTGILIGGVLSIIEYYSMIPKHLAIAGTAVLCWLLLFEYILIKGFLVSLTKEIRDEVFDD